MLYDQYFIDYLKERADLVRRLYFITLLLLAFGIGVSGQEPDLTWLRAYSPVPNGPLQSRPDNYSKKDLERFRSILDSFKSQRTLGDWEGIYAAGGPNEVGFSTLRFTLESGFASLYVYTCTPELRNIDYGKVIDSQDMIELVSEVPADSPRKPSRVKLVKVDWGDRRYLVQVNSLKAFAEKAVGIFVPSEDGGGPEWWNFWESGDPYSKLSGRPRLPARFRHLERSAVEATVIRVYPRQIFSGFSTGRSFHTAESAVYRVVVSAGRKQGVKKGLILMLDGTNDKVTITRVGSSTSEGVVVRAINKNTKADHCLSEEAKLIQCPEITRGATASTIVGNFFF
ncbi:MAG TPA: hypothetical protein PKD24_11315 [Pyrinomonadaceae bacterium]|nr:hypothetical protein [Pyrinomonadaceae bacterium]HMP66104.1 hypothetical protein [Pyrinomonadaceae bacterium]